MSNSKVAVVGVGRMGSNMARRLAEKDFTVTAVYDVRREAATPRNRINIILNRNIHFRSIALYLFRISIVEK